MGFSTSSTITSTTSLVRTDDGRTMQSSKFKDQVTYDGTTIADGSTILRSKVQSLKRGLLCHAFWSLCFDDEDEDGMTLKPEEISTVMPSLQGTALEEWEIQQKREKRAWLGLSFSDDFDAMLHKKRSAARIPTSSIAGTERTSRNSNRAPDTIMISRVTAADKYIAADDTKYQMDDDVASEVSLDFPEPNKEVKGQRIQIKKKPPKVIQAKTKLPAKQDTSSIKSDSRKQTTQDATISKTESKLKSLEKQIFGSEKADIDTSPTENKNETKNALVKDEKIEIVQEKVPQMAQIKKDGSSMKEEASKKPSSNKGEKEVKLDNTENEEEKKESNRDRKATKRSMTKQKSIKKANSSKQKKEEISKSMRDAPSVETQDEETIEESVLPNPRFIPDFSERELKLRASNASSEALRWKHAEESRWEYYGDPRRSPVDHWWKEKKRDREYCASSQQNAYTEIRDPVNSGECYQYDSDSDNESYFDRYVSGPSLPSPEQAQEQARRLAAECQKSQKSKRSQFRRRNKYDTGDELDDFAEVGDLGWPRRRILPVIRSTFNANKVEKETADTPLEKVNDIGGPRPNSYKEANLIPVPPGVFQL